MLLDDKEKEKDGVNEVNQRLVKERVKGIGRFDEMGCTCG